jgi:replicative DNA helicase
VTIKPVSPGEAKDIVFTPNEAVKAALATIDQRRAFVGAGVRTGIQPLDDYLLPGRPGEMIGVLGMSSNYKSGLMQWWARYTAGVIMEYQVENECVIYVTWEQAIDEMVAFDLAYTAHMNATDVVQGKLSDAEMERLRVAVGPKRACMPLYLLGHSIQEGRKRPHLTLTAVTQGLVYIREQFQLKPRAIFLDYLQQIEPEGGEDRRMQVFESVGRCKDMALAMGCPVIVGSQANRSVYHEKWGVPGMADSMESSNFEHTCDKLLGVWMPKTSYAVGDYFDAKMGTRKTSFEVTENLLFIRVLKQKLGPAGRWWPLYVDPARNLIAPMERKELTA